MNVSDEMLFPFPALQSPDTEHHADEAVDGDGNPDTGYAHLQRTGGQVDQSDPQPPHADDADKQRKAYIPGTAADAAGNDEKAEKQFGDCGNEQCPGTQSDDLRVIAEQTDDRTGQNGYRNAGSNDHDRTDDADVPGEFVGQIPTFCPRDCPTSAVAV